MFNVNKLQKHFSLVPPSFEPSFLSHSTRDKGIEGIWAQPTKNWQFASNLEAKKTFFLDFIKSSF